MQDSLLQDLYGIPETKFFCNRSCWCLLWGLWKVAPGGALSLVWVTARLLAHVFVRYVMKHETPTEQLEVTRELLAQMSLLRGVDVDDFLPFLVSCPQHLLEPGDILLTPRSAREEVYLVLDGMLQVHLETPDDDPVIMVPPGEGVGELSLLADAPRSAFVVATSRSHLLELNRKIFWELLQRSHPFTLNYMKMLSKRIRLNNAVVLETRALQQTYKRHAMTDGLTGLHNRRWFDEVSPRLFERGLQEQSPLTLVMADLDRFKVFNDTYGHQAGDYGLFFAAQVFKVHFRPTDVVSRYGGEEFVVIMPRTRLYQARIACERVRERLSECDMTLPDGRVVPPLTVSMGMAERPEDDCDLTELIRRADEALYRAKDEGRNRCCVWEA